MRPLTCIPTSKAGARDTLSAISANYLGPGAGSVRGAIKLHNDLMKERAKSAADLRQVLSDALTLHSTGGTK